MPVFSTPTPPAVHVDLPAGDLRLCATERQDTVVEVRPAEPASSDAYARSILVEQADGVITVKAPDGQRSRRAVHVDIALPEGSSLLAHTASTDVTTTGRLGEVAITCASGDVTVEHAVALRITTASG